MNVQHTVLIYRGTDEDDVPNGREVVLGNVDFEPLGYADLLGTQSKGPTKLSLRVRSGVVVACDDPGLKPGTRINGDFGEFTTHLTVKTIGLVPGGWLPSGLAALTGATVGFDLCTLATVKKAFKGRSEGASDKDFLDFLNSPGVRINPLFSIIEGTLQRAPTDAEVRALAHRVRGTLQAVLPRAVLVPGSEESVEGAIGLAQESAAGIERERAFLLSVIPLLRKPVAEARKGEVWAAVVDAFQKSDLSRRTLSFFAALSCVVAPQGRNHARGVLKPGTHPYGPKDAYNALADLRQLVLLSNAYALYPDDRIMYCTDDFNFAAFWVGLEPRNFVRTDAGTTFDFTGNHLFPGISEDQWRDVAG
ncbi:hypothetical protein [Tahibacter aquaticus]|uniref:hypothetical protein n=1 Tax=Tahibacter aquaticus TaxID=520092 RepID=UPI001061ED2C|nr:hypothetical protein [Tahibacter aquaticus]